MSVGKHTPGPWSPNLDGTSVRDSEGLLLCILSARCTVADARLLAAAPDLLEACEAALDMCADGGDPEAVIKLLQGSIAKATGGDQ